MRFAADDTFVTREIQASIAAFLRGNRSWDDLVALGLPAMAVSEDVGGLGFDLRQEAKSFEALARGVYDGPLLAGALAMPFLDSRRHGLLAEGRIFTLAWVSPGGPWALSAEAPGGTAEPADDGWRITGTYALVPSLEAAEAVVVVADAGAGPAAFVIDLPAQGVECSPLEGFDPTRSAGVLRLDRVGGDLVVDGEALTRAVEQARTRTGCLLAAEALGVGTTAVDQALAHVKQRHAFGRPLAEFQAVSHLLADAFTRLVVARGVLDWALAVREREPGALAPVAAAAARAVAAEAAVHAAECALQLFGAMGFTWEAAVHSLLRRAQWIAAFDQPAPAVLAQLPDALRAHAPVPTTELLDDAQEAEWRAHVRSWIDAHLDAGRRGVAGADPRRNPTHFAAEWARLTLADGLSTVNWPADAGGQGRSIVEAGIAAEEIARAHPRAWEYRCAVEIVAPSIVAHARPEQGERTLKAIRAGERWAQGFSEPDAGSDLAALQTSATRTDGGFRLNGVKVWITAPERADRLLVLARTSGRRSKGITCFVVSTHAPGVTIRPLRDITGGFDEFAEVYFDDVFVSEEDVLGEVDGGWQVTLGQLDDERRRGAFEEAGELDHLCDRIFEVGWAAAADPALPARLGRAWCGLVGLKMINRRATRAMDEGGLMPEGLVTKLVFSEVGQQLADLALDVMGPEAILGSHDAAAAAGRHVRLVARSWTIYAGSTEIMRSLIAEQVLGLPRSR